MVKKITNLQKVQIKTNNYNKLDDFDRQMKSELPIQLRQIYKIQIDNIESWLNGRRIVLACMPTPGQIDRQMDRQDINIDNIKMWLNGDGLYAKILIDRQLDIYLDRQIDRQIDRQKDR